jgi:hypothetical protein
MSYYKKLNLPANPFKDWDAVYAEVRAEFASPRFVNKNHKNIDPHGLLSDELEALAKALDIKFTNIVCFCNGRAKSFNETRLVHSDVYWDYQHNTWKNYKCGINWELRASNLFTWWNMDAVVAVPPLSPYTTVDDEVVIDHDLAKLHSVHYKKRLSLGIPKEAIKLDETYITGPTLVRTEVPHHTIFDDTDIRVGISLRIDETELNSWDKIVKQFESVTISEYRYT